MLSSYSRYKLKVPWERCALPGWSAVSAAALRAGWSSSHQPRMSRAMRSAGAPVHPTSQLGVEPGDTVRVAYTMTVSLLGKVHGSKHGGLRADLVPEKVKRALDRAMSVDEVRAAVVVERGTHVAAAAAAAPVLRTPEEVRFCAKKEALLAEIVAAARALDARALQTGASAEQVAEQLLCGDTPGVDMEGPGAELAKIVQDKRNTLRNWRKKQKKRSQNAALKESGPHLSHKTANAGDLRWSAVFRQLIDVTEPSVRTISTGKTTRAFPLRMVLQKGQLKSISSALPAAACPFEGQQCLDERWLQADRRGPCATIQLAPVPAGCFTLRGDQCGPMCLAAVRAVQPATVAALGDVWSGSYAPWLSRDALERPQRQMYLRAATNSIASGVPLIVWAATKEIARQKKLGEWLVSGASHAYSANAQVRHPLLHPQHHPLHLLSSTPSASELDCFALAQ